MAAANADAPTRDAPERPIRDAPASPPAGRRVRRIALALAALALSLLAAGCSTAHPGPIAAGELSEAQTFPYFRVYWVGRRFEGRPLAAVDGLKSYIGSVGESVYYGDCVQSKGIFGGGSCQLPLQVTTVIYHLHPNKPLGPQHNILVRGVPAVVYDEGRSIEVYSGRVAIDIFSDTYEHAIAAARELLPVNAPGSATADLPLPVYCPELFGPTEVAVERVMQALPAQACQRAQANEAFNKAVQGS
ncbi:MAG TPA: hypothetical protein VKG82_00475 [Solirubrobacteraceae bacterium]|nr:hypothetical protein [Solirubrobacteraceae bacterium]